MGMSHRTFEVWRILLAGLPNNAMTVDSTRRHRQRVKKLRQPRTPWRRITHGHRLLGTNTR
jgi:hypothetical protein